MSLNIGDIAIALTEKDSERLTLRNELNKLEDFQAAGTERLLRVTATGVKKEGLVASKVVYSYSIDHTNYKHNGKAEGEIVEFQLLSEKDVIDVIAEVATVNADGERTTLTFLAQLPTSKISSSSQTDNIVSVSMAPAVIEAAAATTSEETPAVTETTAPAEEAVVPETQPPTAPVAAVDEEWVVLPLDAVDGDDADSTATIVITAKRITVATAIAEKSRQLDQAVTEITVIQQQLKDLQNNAAKEQKAKAATTTATKKKTTTTSATGNKRKSTTGKVVKKNSKNSQNSNQNNEEDEDENEEEKPSAVQKKPAAKGFFSAVPSFTELQSLVINGGFIALNVALTNRAFVFFGLAAAGVYKYGDYASV